MEMPNFGLLPFFLPNILKKAPGKPCRRKIETVKIIICYEFTQFVCFGKIKALVDIVL